jgi:hypothetical protein
MLYMFLNKIGSEQNRFMDKIVSEQSRCFGLQLGPARQTHNKLTKVDHLGSISWVHARHDRGRIAQRNKYQYCL